MSKRLVIFCEVIDYMRSQWLSESSQRLSKSPALFCEEINYLRGEQLSEIKADYLRGPI